MDLISRPTISRLWTQNILVCLLLYPWFNEYSFIFLFSSIICYFYPNYRCPAVIMTTIVTAITGGGVFYYIALGTVAGRLLSLFSYSIFIFISYLYLKHKPKFPLSVLTAVGAILIISLLNYEGYTGKNILYGLTILWAANFFIIIKEADENYEKKSLAEICFSLCAPWNSSILLNLTTKEVRQYSVQSRNEFLDVQKSAVILLMRVVPIILFLKAVLIVIMSNGLQNISWTDFVKTDLRVFAIDRTNIFSSVAKNIGIADAGLRYLFTLIFVGTYSVISLVYMAVASIAVSRIFGFNIPYPVLNFSLLSSPGVFIKSIYHYYSQTIIQVFYIRLINLLKKLKLHTLLSQKQRRIKKIIYLYAAVLVGGVGAHTLVDIYQMLWRVPFYKIITYISSGIPFFLLLASMVLFSSRHLDESSKPSNRPFNIIKVILISFTTILSLCLLFSLRGFLLLQVGWREYFNIFAEIFKSLWRLLTF